MSNNAYLIGSNLASPTEAYREKNPPVFLEASYILPVLWTAMYEAADIQFTSAEASGDMNASSDLTSTKERCVARLAQRREFLVGTLGLRSEKVFDQFSEYIAQAGVTYFHICLGDLWCMHTGDEEYMRDELEYSIRRVDGSHAALVQLEAEQEELYKQKFPRKKCPHKRKYGTFLDYANFDSLAEIDDHGEFSSRMAGFGVTHAMTWDIDPNPPPQEPLKPKLATRPLPFINIVERLKSAFRR